MTTRLQVKQSHAQQTRQVLSVMECIVECGVAAICQNRGLFPPSFFVSRDTGSTAVTTFNMDVLCGGDNDNSTLSVEESHSLQQRHESPSSALEVSSERRGSSKSQNSIISPLTCATSTTSSIGSQTSIRADFVATRSDNDRINSKCSTNDKVMRAEALLLLHWIRKGVFQILKEGKLARLIFGICIPSQQYHNVEKRNHRNSKVSHSMDKLLESYAFDLSQLQPHVAKGSCINKNKVQNAFTALFRNLDSFSSLQTRIPIIQLPTTNGGASIANMELPQSRYFTIRIEFIDNQLPLTLPESIDPSHFLSRSIDTSSSVTSERNIPSMEESLMTLAPTQLGKVMEDHITGISLRLTAFCGNNEHINNHKMEQETQNTYCKSQQQQVTRGKRKPMPQAVDRSQISDTSSSSSSNRLPIIADSTIAFAIPYTSVIKKPKGVHKNKGGFYVPCIILDHRSSRKTAQIDYKVKFLDEALRQKNMQKQWITCQKVISKQAMMDDILTILKRDEAYLRDPPLIESLADNMKVGLNVILEAVYVMKKNDPVQFPSSVRKPPDGGFDKENTLSVRPYKRRKCNKKKEGTRTSRRFSFAMNPIQVIVK